jgi:N-formylglutamate amidohydrolase
VLAGLGVIPRIVADGKDIYGKKLNYFDARRRIAACYEPYHQALAELIAAARRKFGCAVLIDCHSMPSAGGAPFREGDKRIDFVLGDRFGASCAPSLVSLVEQTLAKMTYNVSRNAPYAGGFVAAAYGRPAEGVHVLQIEINRALYLDEARLARNERFEDVRANMRRMMVELARVEPAALRPAQAAE